MAVEVGVLGFFVELGVPAFAFPLLRADPGVVLLKALPGVCPGVGVVVGEVRTVRGEERRMAFPAARAAGSVGVTAACQASIF